jgi:hypothetical protein
MLPEQIIFRGQLFRRVALKEQDDYEVNLADWTSRFRRGLKTIPWLNAVYLRLRDQVEAGGLRRPQLTGPEFREVLNPDYVEYQLSQVPRLVSLQQRLNSEWFDHPRIIGLVENIRARVNQALEQVQTVEVNDLGVLKLKLLADEASKILGKARVELDRQMKLREVERQQQKEQRQHVLDRGSEIDRLVQKVEPVREEPGRRPVTQFLELSDPQARRPVKAPLVLYRGALYRRALMLRQVPESLPPAGAAPPGGPGGPNRYEEIKRCILTEVPGKEGVCNQLEAVEAIVQKAQLALEGFRRLLTTDDPTFLSVINVLREKIPHAQDQIESLIFMSQVAHKALKDLKHR